MSSIKLKLPHPKIPNIPPLPLLQDSIHLPPSNGKETFNTLQTRITQLALNEIHQIPEPISELARGQLPHLLKAEVA